MARSTSSSLRTVVLFAAIAMLAARANAAGSVSAPELMVERAGAGLERWLAEAQQPAPADPAGELPLWMRAERRSKDRGAGRREARSSSSRRRTSSTSHHSTSTHASSQQASSSATPTPTSTSSPLSSSAAVQQSGASMVQGPPQTSSPATAGTMAGGGGGSSHTAVIAGAAVGGAAVLGIGGALGALWVKRRSRARSAPRHHQHLSSSSRVLDISAPWDPWPAKKSRAPLRQPPWEPWSSRPALESGGETSNASEMRERERESEPGTANPFADNPFSPVSARSVHSWGDAQSPMSPDVYDAYPHPGGGPFARRMAVTPDAMV